ncbi:MAG: hypothetical protein K0S98_1611, partial [Propionibacteriaceae bacterium]|nr:hypothetical protein [Propionibacteriaceae bacterium]
DPTPKATLELFAGGPSTGPPEHVSERKDRL